eukprot:508513-Pyramimonas_sp.AAC.1
MGASGTILSCTGARGKAPQLHLMQILDQDRRPPTVHPDLHALKRMSIKFKLPITCLKGNQRHQADVIRDALQSPPELVISSDRAAGTVV